jgi:hypothetical protein
MYRSGATMTGNVLHIALSESYSLVWALEALASENYFCVRCGVELELDTFENEFRHPPSTYCSAMHSNRRCAVILLQSVIEHGANALALTQICKSCGQTHEHSIEPNSPCYLLSIEEINDAVLVDIDLRLLISMRPAPNSLPKLAQQLGACWIEVDPRNVLSGTPILILSGNMGQDSCTVRTATQTEAEKINNPYSRIGISIHGGGQMAE